MSDNDRDVELHHCYHEWQLLEAYEERNAALEQVERLEAKAKQHWKTLQLMGWTYSIFVIIFALITFFHTCKR